METDSGRLCLPSERLCHKKNTNTTGNIHVECTTKQACAYTCRLSSVSGSSLNGQQNNNRNILLSYWKQLQSENNLPIKKLKRLFSEQNPPDHSLKKELKHRQVNIFPCGGREVKGFAAVSSFVLLAMCTCIKHAHANSYAHKNTTYLFFFFVHKHDLMPSALKNKVKVMVEDNRKAKGRSLPQKLHLCSFTQNVKVHVKLMSAITSKMSLGHANTLTDAPIVFLPYAY